MSAAIAFGFYHNSILVRTSDGLDDVVCEPLDYLAKNGDRYRVPVGATTDGLSVPRCLQNIYPATGKQWKSGVLHDAAYRNQLWKWSGDTWAEVSLTQKQCDDLLDEAMESQGAPWAKRHFFYRSLRMFGFAAFNDNRSTAGRIRNQLQAV